MSPGDDIGPEPPEPGTTGRGTPSPPPWWPKDEPWPPRRGRDWAGRWSRQGRFGGPPWAPGFTPSEGSVGTDDRGPLGSRAGPPWSYGYGPPWRGGPWRSRRGGMTRGGFVWQLGCLVVLLLFVASTIGAVGVWAIATTVGIVGSSEIGRAVAIGLLVLGIVGVLGIARRVRSFAAPLDELVEAAGRIQDGDYSVRVATRGPGGMRLLGHAFNDMSARLEATDRQRRTYLADVTHELRTPLSVIQGQLEAVLDGVYPADREHLEPLLAEARRLDALIEDLRTLTLVETGGLTLHREAVDLAVLVNDAVGSFQAAAKEAGIAVLATVPADLPVVEADPIRLRSVLTNLVANAVRHTPAGGSVRVAAASRPGVVQITVTDTGPGFPPDLLPRVFERFVKGTGSEGSGLGLAIARDLVVAHGGTISARNETGGGATVAFTLPVDQDAVPT